MVLGITLRISHMLGKLSYPWTAPSSPESACLFSLTNGLFPWQQPGETEAWDFLVAAKCKKQWHLICVWESPFSQLLAWFQKAVTMGSLFHQLLKASLRCPAVEFMILVLLPDRGLQAWDNRPNTLVGCLKETGRMDYYPEFTVPSKKITGILIMWALKAKQALWASGRGAMCRGEGGVQYASVKSILSLPPAFLLMVLYQWQVYSWAEQN